MNTYFKKGSYVLKIRISPCFSAGHVLKFKIFFVMIIFLWFTRGFHILQKNMKVENLFEDIKDGVYLLSLLEALSGEKLVSSAFTPTIQSHFSFL